MNHKQEDDWSRVVAACFLCLICIILYTSVTAKGLEGSGANNLPVEDFSNPALVLMRNNMQDQLLATLLPIKITVPAANNAATAATLTVVAWQYCGAGAQASQGKIVGVAYEGDVTLPVKGGPLPQSPCQSSLSAIADHAVRQEGVPNWVAALSVMGSWSDSNLKMTVVDAAVAQRTGGSAPPSHVLPGLKQNEDPITLLTLNTSQVNVTLSGDTELRLGLAVRFLNEGILFAVFPQPTTISSLIPDSAFTISTTGLPSEATTIAKIPFRFFNTVSDNLKDKSFPIVKTASGATLVGVRTLSVLPIATGLRFKGRATPTPGDSLITLGMDFVGGDLKSSDVKVLESKKNSASSSEFVVADIVAKSAASALKNEWRDKLLRPEKIQSLGVVKIDTRRFSVSTDIVKSTASSTDLFFVGYTGLREVK